MRRRPDGLDRVQPGRARGRRDVAGHDERAGETPSRSSPRTAWASVVAWALISARCAGIASVSHDGMTRPAPLPSCGQIAPRASLCPPWGRGRHHPRSSALFRVRAGSGVKRQRGGRRRRGDRPARPQCRRAGFRNAVRDVSRNPGAGERSGRHDGRVLAVSLRAIAKACPSASWRLSGRGAPCLRLCKKGAQRPRPRASRRRAWARRQGDARRPRGNAPVASGFRRA